MQPKEPDDLDVEGLLKGIYHYADAPEVSGNGDAPRVQLLASGVGFPWIQKAQQLLAEDWGVAADLWSVTSWNELARDARRGREVDAEPPRARSAQGPVRHQHAGGRGRPGRRGERLHARRTPADRALGPGRLPRRSAPTASASPTPGRPRGASSRSTPRASSWRRSGRSPSAARSSPRSVAEAFDEVPHRRPDRGRRRQAGRRRRLTDPAWATALRRGASRSCSGSSAWCLRGPRSRTSTRCSRASARSWSCSA